MAGKLNGYHSGLTRETIRDVYEREIVNSMVVGRIKKRDSLRVHYVLPFLSTMPHVEKFCKEVLHILDKSVLTHNALWNAGDAANAFLTMERYALNILDHPWKVEFKTLKLFNGFYASKVQGSLEDAIRLFYMMGYVAGSSRHLWMKEPASRSMLVMVACDCFVASVECHIMQGILYRLERCVSIGDVYKSRMECTGDEEKCAQWTKRNCGMKKKSQSLDEERRERDILRYNRRKDQDMYYRNYGVGSSNSSVNRTIGTSRTPISSSENQIHHILRSKENSELHRDGAIHRSWDFLKPETFTEERGLSHSIIKSVQDEKENRGNILHAKASRDSGYNSKPSSKEISYQGSPHLSVSSPEVLCEGDLQVDTEPEQNNPCMNELNIKDPPSPKSGNSSQPSPGADYIFEEATVDDHIQKSLQYLKKQDSSASTWSSGEGKEDLEQGDEWAGVREKLRSDYGDSYFEGDRENVLNKSPHSSPSTDSLSYRSRPLMNKNDSPKAWTPSTGDEIEEDFDDENNTNTVLRRPGISRQRLVNRTPTPPQTGRTGSPFENVEEAAMKIIRSDSPPLEGDDPSGVSIRKQPSFKGYTFGKGKKAHIIPIKVDIPLPPEVHTESPKQQPSTDHTPHQSPTKLPPPIKEKSAIVKRIAARKLNKDSERRSLYDNVPMEPVPESPPGEHSCHNEDSSSGEEDVSPPPYTFLQNAKTEAGANQGSSSPTKNPDWQFMATPRVPDVVSHSNSQNTSSKHILSDSKGDFGCGPDPQDKWAVDDIDGVCLWQCSSCTYANEDFNSVCQICGKSRELGAEKVPLTSGGPHCPACTYVNKPGARRCSMCEQELKGCPTYI